MFRCFKAPSSGFDRRHFHLLPTNALGFPNVHIRFGVNTVTAHMAAFPFFPRSSTEYIYNFALSPAPLRGRILTQSCMRQSHPPKHRRAQQWQATRTANLRSTPYRTRRSHHTCIMHPFVCSNTFLSALSVLAIRSLEHSTGRLEHSTLKR